MTTKEEFQQEKFDNMCSKIEQSCLITNDTLYGHRLDAMPFVCPKDVWERFGPMNQTVQVGGLTGDTDFFDRCKRGGVEITKSLDAISYHCGGIETQRNKKKGVYT